VCDDEGVNGVMAAPSSGGTLTAAYPVQPTTHLTTHQLQQPEHTSNIAPQFTGTLTNCPALTQCRSQARNV